MKIYCVVILFLCSPLYTVCALQKTTYSFPHDPIDVVIPCHKKDAPTIDRTIAHVKKYVQDLRRVIIISAERYTDNAEWADETLFPFNKELLAHEIFKSPHIATYQLNTPKSRMGWIHQQFLKLFAAYYIPEISSNVLIVDADVLFLKPVTFLQENGAGLYATRHPFGNHYFAHIIRLLPRLRKVYPQYSGVTHHMLFQKVVLDDLFNLISKQHKLEPWVAIARAIPLHNNEMRHTSMSEYDLYFNFVFTRTDQVKIRPLKWKDIDTASEINQAITQGYDYVALHVRPSFSRMH